MVMLLKLNFIDVRNILISLSLHCDELKYLYVTSGMKILVWIQCHRK